MLSLFKLPVQLFPDIERPQIAVQTFWRSASPKEIESEIIANSEEVTPFDAWILYGMQDLIDDIDNDFDKNNV